MLLLISSSSDEPSINTPILLDLKQIPHYNDVDYWLSNNPKAWYQEPLMAIMQNQLSLIDDQHTHFGIWLHRHSSFQVQGLKVDNLDEIKNEDERIAFVRNNAHPFMTILYIGGHTMMYVGR